MGFAVFFTGNGCAAGPRAAAGGGCRHLPAAGEVHSGWRLLWHQAAATPGAPVPSPRTTSTSHAAGQRRHPDAAHGQGGATHAVREGVSPPASVHEGGPTGTSAWQGHGSQERKR